MPSHEPTCDAARSEGGGRRAVPPAVIVGAACSMASGAMHIAASQTHLEHLDLSRLMLLEGTAQLLAGVALLVTSSRWVRAAGAGINAVALGAWAVTRLVGVSWVGGLEVAESPQLTDTVTAGLAAASVVALSIILAADRSTHDEDPRGARAARSVAIGTAVAVTALSLVGISTLGSHDHAHGDEAAAVEVPDAWRMGATDEEVVDTEQLTVATQEAVAAFASLEDAEEQGFVRINGDHMLHVERVFDDKQLDPTAIESLVVGERDGKDEIIGGMYLLDIGQTMRDVPRRGGPLMVWHTHGGFCFEVSGVITAGSEAKESCPEGSYFLDDPPMYHVYTDPKDDEGVVRTADACGTFVFTDLPHDGVVPGCGPDDHASHDH